jgi:hypothetical protein
MSDSDISDTIKQNPIKIWGLLIVLFFAGIKVSSQNFGGTPNRIKYLQIETDTVQVIFPEGMGYWGQRVANLTTFMAQMDDSSLVDTPIKTSIIIRNLTTIPNGFVAWAPYRSELFTTPPFNQFNGISSWTDMLTIHEYRHVEQFSKIMYKRKWWPEHLLFGEAGWAGISYIVLPDWYFEGDATKVETMYSASGRGRVPEFYLQFPALRVMGNKYKFEKTRSGSFKDYVPNHYALGYHLTSYLEQEFGANAWNEIVTSSIRKYALMSLRIKKTTGLNNRGLYADAMKAMDEVIGDTVVFNDEQIKGYDIKDYIQYELVKNYNARSIIYLKSSFRNIPAYFLYNGKTEKKLFEPGFRTNGHWYDLKDNKLIWVELLPDAYWKNENYSALKIFDIETGKSNYTAIKKTKWFYPKWSDNQNQIGVLELGESGDQKLVLLDLNAVELFSLPIKRSDFISAIAKVNDNEFTVVVNKDETARLMIIDVASGEQEQVGPVFYGAIRHPIVSGDLIYFSTVTGHTEQIMRVNVNKDQVEQITDVPFRAIDPMIKDDSLYYVSYEGVGYSIRKTSIQSLKPFVPTHPEMAFYTDLEKTTHSILPEVSDKNYEVKRYKKSKGFYVHSWAPWVLGPNFGLSIFMENKIGTITSDVTYVYNTIENASQFRGSVTYAQFYPKISVGLSHTLNRDANNGIIASNSGIFSGRSWSESEANIGVLLPLFLNRGKWFRSLSLKTALHYLKANYSEIHQGIPNLQFPFYRNRLIFSNQKITSRRQIFTRWGQSIIVDQSQSFDPDIAQQYYVLSTFYFPGIMKTHSFYISPSYKYEPLKQYYYLDGYPATFGYNRFNAEQSFGVKVRYTFPFWYPDFGIRGAIFFKRLFATVFYDYSKFLKLPTSSGDFLDQLLQRSYGFDLNFDLVIFRIFPIRLGLRTVYRIDAPTDEKPLKFEFLLYTISF